MQTNRRSGITLIEVLVVVVIVSILLAVILPAIQSARVRARTTECANNLRQIGLALQMHESSTRLYPPAEGDRVIGGRSRGALTAFVHLLPYLEQQALHDKIDLSIPTYGTSFPNPAHIAANSTVMAARIGLFLCPSDDRYQLSWTGNTNYALNVGPHPLVHPTRVPGAFVLHRAANSAAFRDGLGNTVALSERLKGDGNVLRFDRRRDVWYAPFAGLPDALSADETVEQCNVFGGQYPGMHHHSNVGSSWYLGFVGYQDCFYNHVDRPNTEVVACELNPPPVQRWGSYPARSNHRGGVNVVTMAASVRFVSDSVDLNLWRAIGSRAGGEITSGF